MGISEQITNIAKQEKKTSRNVATLDTQQKNRVLTDIRDLLISEKKLIQKENKKDLEKAEQQELSNSMIDRLTLSDRFFDHGYIDKTEYSDRAQGGTFGINWYFNDMVRFMFNYNHVEFDDYVADADDDDEDVFMARFQLDF